MKPSEKAPALATMLEKFVGRTTAITSGKCVPAPIGCGRTITADDFSTWPDLDKKKYRIPGLCNNCQATIWG